MRLTNHNDEKARRIHGLMWKNGLVFEIHQSLERIVPKSASFVLLPGEEGEFLRYSIELPCCRHMARQDCQDCVSGVNIHSQETCGVCEGGGHEVSYDWNPALAVLALLREVFSNLCVQSLEALVGEAPAQLMNLGIQLPVAGESQGAISADIGPSVREFLSQVTDQDLPEVVTAMERVYYAVEGRADIFAKGVFAASITKGTLNICCPGRCRLHTEGSRIISNVIDYPVQQLALLAGLAVFFGAVEMSL